MGDTADLRQPESGFRPLVAFDFDGTLTVRDSFVAFLQWRAGLRRLALGVTRLGPAVARYLSHPDRGRLKEAVVREFLTGLTQAELDAETHAFAVRNARALLRRDALRTWRRWRSEGARLVIVTASPEPIIAPFARGLGADLLIGTRLEADADGRLTGRFASPNCRGPEKVRRLREAFGEDVWLEAAYGDSDGDREMIELADIKGMKAFNGAGESGGPDWDAA